MKISIAGEPQKLKKKLFHVTKEQVNEIETSIVSGDWSSDLPINLAQHYLQSQFPELNGLQCNPRNSCPRLLELNCTNLAL